MREEWRKIEREGGEPMEEEGEADGRKGQKKRERGGWE